MSHSTELQSILSNVARRVDIRSALSMAQAGEIATALNSNTAIDELRFYQPLTSEATALLAQALLMRQQQHGAQLKILSFSETALTEDAFMPVADVLAQGLEVSTLDLRGNQFNERALAALGAALAQADATQTLQLDGNPIDTNGLRALARAGFFQNGTATTAVSLRGTALTGNDAELLMRGIGCHGYLRDVALSFAEQADAGAQHLSEGLPMQVVSTLSLGGTSRFSRTGMNHLVAAIHRAGVQSVDLAHILPGGYFAGLSQARAFASLLAVPGAQRLQRLSVSDVRNHVLEVAAGPLALPQSALVVLEYHSTTTRDDILAFLNAARTNRGMQSFWLRSGGLPQASDAELESALSLLNSTNNALLYVRLYSATARMAMLLSSMHARNLQLMVSAYTAASSGDVVTLAQLLDDGISFSGWYAPTPRFNAVEQNENTLWHVAAEFGQVAVGQLLQARNVPSNLRNRQGLTPLDVAVVNNHSVMADFIRTAAGVGVADEQARARACASLRDLPPVPAASTPRPPTAMVPLPPTPAVMASTASPTPTATRLPVVAGVAGVAAGVAVLYALLAVVAGLMFRQRRHRQHQHRASASHAAATSAASAGAEAGVYAPAELAAPHRGVAGYDDIDSALETYAPGSGYAAVHVATDTNDKRGGGAASHYALAESPLDSGSTRGGAAGHYAAVDSPLASGSTRGGGAGHYAAVDSPLDSGSTRGGAASDNAAVDSRLATGALATDTTVATLPSLSDVSGTLFNSGASSARASASVSSVAECETTAETTSTLLANPNG